ncbi:aldehyde dehydrogenase domain-containing protein [Bisporella sp. PMI_857]|nr:aldehyde dehydrogenase domain-containing protein [Bisporella sp. PMI_857]
MAQSQFENRLFINNEFVDAKSKSTFPVFNPATEVLVTEVAQAGELDVNDAVDAATKAFTTWKEVPVTQRAPLFAKLAELIRRDADELWTLEQVAMGRTYSFSRFEIMGTAGLFDMYASAGMYVQGKSSLNTPGMVALTLKQPFGVVAAIIPWNVSLIMFALKVAPAIAAGNCIVIKSSEKSPLGCLKLGELIKEAGFPPGVVNIVSGFGHITGKLMAEHMNIRKIAFTGSVATGKKVMQMAAGSNLKNVTLELGGKSPAIIFADADLERAVHAVEFSIHHNSGQHCQANSRVFVEESVMDKFIERFSALMRSRKVGDPAEKDTFHGPQCDKGQRDRIVSLLESGKKSGELVMGGVSTTVNGKGYYIEPTIFKNVPDGAAISREEVFGPVVVVNSFKTEDEALARANDTEYGLFGK